MLAVSGHKYGNYHQYYEFHATNSRMRLIDSRVPNIFHQLWSAQGKPCVFSILDIGCNEGNLSMEMLTAAKAQLPSSVQCKLCGIDIDSHLIEKANSKYRTSVVSRGEQDCIWFETIDLMDDLATMTFMDFYFTKNNMSGFSFVSLFSITMWVHLNHGDAGLKHFIDISAKLLANNGNLLIEPQPWKCYKAAEKRTRRLGMEKPKYLSEIALRLPERDISAYVVERVSHVQSYWCLGKEDWGRSIFIFHRNTLPALTSLADDAQYRNTADIDADAVVIVPHESTATIMAAALTVEEEEKRGDCVVDSTHHKKARMMGSTST